MVINPAPIRDTLTANSSTWVSWFTQAYKILWAVRPSISADRGDASATVKASEDALTQVFSTALTTGRTLTLSTVHAYSGAKFRVVRKASATGASGLDVGGLKTLAVGTWCDVEYNGTAWILTGYGAL